MRFSGRAVERARLGSLIAFGAFAVHQLRYLLAYGGDSGDQLSRQGHGYLEVAVPFLAVLALGVTSATLVLGLTRRSEHRSRRAAGALGCAAALLAIFCLQELIEGALAPGHAGGLAALVAGGGWLALPLSLLVGAVLSLSLRGLRSVERALAGLRGRAPFIGRAPRVRGRALGARRRIVAGAPLAFGLARRPPPALA